MISMIALLSMIAEARDQIAEVRGQIADFKSLRYKQRSEPTDFTSAI
jgi:hypothetical protein